MPNNNKVPFGVPTKNDPKAEMGWNIYGVSTWAEANLTTPAEAVVA